MKNDIIKLLNGNGIVYRMSNDGSMTIFWPDESPIKGKRCVAYYCQSMAGEGKKPWKVEVHGVHLKWVATREEAQQLINTIESN
jgi:hypothetical protein